METDLEDTTLSHHTVLKLKEIVNLQASLWEAAQRLREGSERLDALREIDRFQTQMAVFIRRLGSEALAPWRSPKRVGDAHLADQPANFQGHGWSTAATPRFPTPIRSKSCRTNLPSKRSNRELSAAISDDMIARLTLTLALLKRTLMRCLMSEMSSFIAAMSAWIARKCSKLFATRFRFDTVVSAMSALFTCR